MIISRLTSRSRTIPMAVRSALGLGVGDEIVYAILDGGRVAMTKAPTDWTKDPFQAFREWEGEPDRKAYSAL